MAECKCFVTHLCPTFADIRLRGTLHAALGRPVVAQCEQTGCPEQPHQKFLTAQEPLGKQPPCSCTGPMTTLTRRACNDTLASSICAASRPLHEYAADSPRVAGSSPTHEVSASDSREIASSKKRRKDSLLSLRIRLQWCAGVPLDRSNAAASRGACGSVRQNEIRPHVGITQQQPPWQART